MPSWLRKAVEAAQTVEDAALATGAAIAVLDARLSAATKNGPAPVGSASRSPLPRHGATGGSRQG
ncbi:hypothetical protein X732_33220 [Mesorhizobium sp. L2C066B000]|nr:hypothetical protein X732_33220 [Mesorhizobium sp. L2C066B000]